MTSKSNLRLLFIFLNSFFEITFSFSQINLSIQDEIRSKIDSVYVASARLNYDLQLLEYALKIDTCYNVIRYVKREETSHLEGLIFKDSTSNSLKSLTFNVSGILTGIINSNDCGNSWMLVFYESGETMLFSIAVGLLEDVTGFYKSGAIESKYVTFQSRIVGREVHYYEKGGVYSICNHEADHDYNCSFFSKQNRLKSIIHFDQSGERNGAYTKLFLGMKRNVYYEHGIKK